MSTCYVVRRLSWVPDSYDGVRFCDAGSDGVHSGVPIRVFADRAAAGACCRELESEARRLVHPGRVTVEGHLEGDAAAEWCRRVAALGLPPPESVRSPYGGGSYFTNEQVLGWWAAQAATASPELREAVWESLPVPRFYDVVEAPLED